MPQTPEELDADINAHIADLEGRLAEVQARERQHRFREIIGSIVGCLTYLAFAAIPVILLIAFIKSIGWVVDVLLPMLGVASGIALLLVLVCVPFAFPRKTRGWAGLGIMISSYVVGLHLWVWSLVIALATAGIVWVIVGLIFAGVGVVAVAVIGTAIQGEWWFCLQVIIGVVIALGLRALGAYLIDKSEPKDDDLPTPPLPPDFYGSPC